jgi:hypothetical protein
MNYNRLYRVSQNSRIPNSERGREGPSGARKIQNALQRVHLQTNVSLWGESRFFFYFHIWTTEVIPYNALNSEFANFETPCIIKSRSEFFCAKLRD